MEQCDACCPKKRLRKEDIRIYISPTRCLCKDCARYFIPMFKSLNDLLKEVHPEEAT
jgi:hypothetical protein